MFYMKTWEKLKFHSGFFLIYFKLMILGKSVNALQVEICFSYNAANSNLIVISFAKFYPDLQDNQVLKYLFKIVSNVSNGRKRQ